MSSVQQNTSGQLTRSSDLTLSSSGEGQSSQTTPVEKFIREWVQCIFHDEDPRTYQHIAVAPRPLPACIMKLIAESGENAFDSSDSSLRKRSLTGRLVWSSGNGPVDSTGRGITRHQLPLHFDNSIDPMYLRIGHLVSDFHYDDELGMILLELQRVSVDRVFGTCTSEAKFLRQARANPTMIGDFVDHSRDAPDAQALRKLWSVAMKTTGIGCDTAPPGNTDRDDGSLSRIVSCVIMAPVEIADLPHDCFSGIVIFIGISGYNSRKSTIHGQRYNADKFAEVLQTYCRNRGGFLVVVNTFASLLQSETKKDESGAVVAGPVALSKMGAHHLLPIAEISQNDHRATKTWFSDSFAPVSMSFFSDINRLAHKCAGKNFPESEKNLPTLEYLRASKNVVTKLFENMLISLSSPEEDSPVQKDDPDFGYYDYLRSTLSLGDPKSGKCAEYLDFIESPTVETSDLACMALLTSPDLHELFPYRFEKGFPKAYSPVIGEKYSEFFASSAEMKKHVYKYGLMMQLTGIDARFRLQERLTEFFVKLRKDSDRISSLDYLPPPPVNGTFFCKRKREMESEEGRKEKMQKKIE